MTPPSLTFAAFRFVLSPQETMSLPPYMGATLRGGFGFALKRLVCLQRGQVCQGCLLNSKCAYFHIFESPHIAGEAGRQASNDPHTFIFEPPLESRGKYEPGEEFAFQLILIGQGIDYLAYFVVAFEELGRAGLGSNKGRFRLARVEDALSPTRNLVYGGNPRVTGQITIRSFSDEVQESKKLDPRQVRLFFQTPTRLKRQKDFHFVSPSQGQSIQGLASELDFPLFIRSLLRRLSWLAELHCGEKWNLDYKGLLAQAEQVKVTSDELAWHDWERYSTRQNTRMKMGGFVGHITFEGDLAPFLHYIKLGEYLHIGKGTAFGLGKYIID